MKNVFVIRGNQDGVIAVTTSLRKAKKIALHYVDTGWDKDQTLEESEFMLKRGEIEASWDEFTLNWYAQMEVNK